MLISSTNQNLQFTYMYIYNFQINLKLQLSCFKEVEKKLKRQLGDHIELEAKKLLAKAVYLFSIGGNDYMSITLNQTNALSSYYKKKIHGAYRMRASHQSLTEDYVQVICAHEPSLIAKMNNIALPILLKKIQRQLPGFKYALYDYYTTLVERTLYST